MTDTTFLLDVLRHEYRQRLHEVMGESDVFDDRGNLILSPDLKVRHKKSGYEYTIAHVKGDKPGEVQIVLREPEEPRFDAPPEGEEVLGGPDELGALNEDDEVTADPRIPELLDPSPEVDIDSRVQAVAALTDEPDEDEVVFVIDQEEFEKEYEVD